MEILQPKQQENIIAAISEAEKMTSGEIKVHLEAICEAGDAFERAKNIFEYLSLHKTALKNGVLIYVAYEDRKFAILGDKGIDAKIGPKFWNSTAEILKENLAKGQIEKALIDSILEAGKQLKEHFPIQTNDTNEIPDELSFG
jgi:uncharacterized membrane protein